MLLMVSSVTLVHADTNYNEGVVDTPAAGQGGAGDITTPGVPNTGTTAADNTMWFVLAVIVLALVGVGAYYMATPRRVDDLP